MYRLLIVVVVCSAISAASVKSDAEQLLNEIHSLLDSDTQRQTPGGDAYSDPQLVVDRSSDISESDYIQPDLPILHANNSAVDDSDLEVTGNGDLEMDRKWRFPLRKYNYGFSRSGKLVCVECWSDSCDDNCERIGLVSQHIFCWANLWDWDDIPMVSKSGSLGSGISTWSEFNFPYDLANWMSRVGNDLFLWQLALPGSHDAGSAQSETIKNVFYRTQSFSIVSQLILGIRVFDIRPTRASDRGIGREDDGIWTHHSKVKGERLSRAVTGVALFLKAYPTETAIFIISHYENVEQADVYAEIKSNCKGLEILFPKGAFSTYPKFMHDDRRFYINSLTLGQSRGGLIVIDESHATRNVGPNGHDGTTDWNDMLNHITNIHPPSMSRPDDTHPNNNRYFQRFVVALSFKFGEPLIETLARSRGLPGLRAWLHTADSDKIGIVEADWFGTSQEVKNLVALIVNKTMEELPHSD